jgi:hypothetical protein
VERTWRGQRRESINGSQLIVSSRAIAIVHALVRGRHASFDGDLRLIVGVERRDDAPNLTGMRRRLLRVVTVR